MGLQAWAKSMIFTGLANFGNKNASGINGSAARWFDGFTEQRKTAAFGVGYINRDDALI